MFIDAGLQHFIVSISGKTTIWQSGKLTTEQSPKASNLFEK